MRRPTLVFALVAVCLLISLLWFGMRGKLFSNKGLVSTQAAAHVSTADMRAQHQELTSPEELPRSQARTAAEPDQDSSTSKTTDASDRMRELRLSTIQAMRSQYQKVKRGSDEEWMFGYKILYQSIFAHLDYLGEYSESDGRPMQSSNGARGDYHTVSSGRVYDWSATTYPELVDMTAMRLSASSERAAHLPSSGGAIQEIPKRELTETQREAIDRYYALAIAELSGPKR